MKFLNIITQNIYNFFFMPTGEKTTLPPNSQSPKDEEAQEIKINLLLIGRTQVGKSAFIKTLLKDITQSTIHIPIGGTGRSTTLEIKRYSRQGENIEINFFDTPGLYDDKGIANATHLKSILNYFQSNQIAELCVLYFTRFDNVAVDASEQQLLKDYASLFTTDEWKARCGVIMPFAGPSIDTLPSSFFDYEELLAKHQENDEKVQLEIWQEHLNRRENEMRELFQYNVPICPIDNRIFCPRNASNSMTLKDGREWLTNALKMICNLIKNNKHKIAFVQTLVDRKELKDEVLSIVVNDPIQLTEWQGPSFFKSASLMQEPKTLEDKEKTKDDLVCT